MVRGLILTHKLVYMIKDWTRDLHEESCSYLFRKFYMLETN